MIEVGPRKICVFLGPTETESLLIEAALMMVAISACAVLTKGQAVIF